MFDNQIAELKHVLQIPLEKSCSPKYVSTCDKCFLISWCIQEFFHSKEGSEESQVEIRKERRVLIKQTLFIEMVKLIDAK